MNARERKMKPYFLFITAILFSCTVFISISQALGALEYLQGIPSTGEITYVLYDASINVYSNVIGVNNLTLGVHWTDWWDPLPNSPELKQKAMAVGFGLWRIFVQGYGPAPCTSWDSTTHTGTYDWSIFDKSIQAIYDVGAEPLLCIDLRTGVNPSGMSIDPDVNLPYVEDFVQFTAYVAQHCKVKGWNVKYWEIFNEAYFYAFDMWNPEQSKLSKVVNIFNQAAGGIHQIFPNALCGTDSSGIKGFLDYFVQYGQGVGFLSFHKYDAWGHWLDHPEAYFSDQDILKYASYGRTMAYSILQTYTVDEMRNVWLKNRGQRLPVIVTETNLNAAYYKGTDPRVQKIFGAVWYAEEVRDFILRGTDHSLYWWYASDAFWGWGTEVLTNKYNFAMVGTGNDPDGIYPPNTEFYNYKFHLLFANNINVGDQLYQSTSTNTSIVSCLAWKHDNELKLLLVGKKDEDSRVYSTGDIYVNPPPPQPYKVKVNLGIPEGTSITIQKIERIDIIKGNIQTETIQYTGSLTLTLNGYSIILLSVPTY